MKKKHRNQLISRLLAMCLAAVMMLSMGITASAEITSSTTGSFNVSGFDTVLATPTVTAYQIIKVNIDDTAKEPEYPMYTWAPSVATWLDAKGYNSYIDSDLGENAVADVFKNGGVVTADMTTFLEELAAAIKAGTITGLASQNENVSATGEASFENMALGEYLIIASGGVKIYQPTTVKLVPEYIEGAWTVGTAVVGDGETALVKGNAPTIDKTVFEINDDPESADRTVAVGDTVTFKLEADVPEYPEDTTKKKFIISDTVGTGLEYQTGTVNVYSDPTCAIEIEADTYILKTGNDTTAPGDSNIQRTFVIEFKEKFFKDQSALKKVYVTYDAKVTSDAFTDTTGGKLDNDAFLGYSNDPYVDNSYREDTDSVTLYTYAINLTKVDTNGEAIIDNTATFELKSGDTALYFKDNNNGVYTHDSSITSDTVGFTKALTTSSTDGTLKIQGLDEGEYTLTETNAPDGYVLPNGTITVEIQDADDISGGPSGEIDTLKGENKNITATGGTEIYVENDTDDGVDVKGTTISFRVVNKTAAEGLFELPVTGGAGTVIFTMAGILLMGGAVALLVVVLRRKRS